jgi:hypothetical protein
MAAMGISPLPTAAMRATEKSGVAIQKVQQEQALGSYHFIDNFERAIARCGRIIETWLPIYDQGVKQVALCDLEGKRKVVTINQPVMNPQTGQVEHYPVEEGEHDVTVSVGPSNASQRDMAQEQLAALVQNLQPLVAAQVIAPPQAAQLLAQSIQMMQLGPIGDKMVETISPQQGGPPVPPQAQQAMAQAQTQVQQLTATLQQLQQENAVLQQERQARVIDNQGRLEIERIKSETQIAVANINTTAQVLQERIDAIHALMKELHAGAHERGLQAATHAHEKHMADVTASHDINQTAMEAQLQPPQPAASPV